MRIAVGETYGEGAMEEKVSLSRALEIVDESVNPLGFESVEVMAAGGRVLAEAANTWVDLPNADVSTLDGYALRAEDTAGAVAGKVARLKIVGASQMGAPFEDVMTHSSCVRVVTGAVVPGEADAVVGDERVKVENGEMVLESAATSGVGIRRRGEEFRVGEAVVEEGTVLHPGWIALLAAAGWQEVKIIKRPRVRVIAAGDELKSLGRSLDPGDVFPSVAGGLVSWCRLLGVGEVRLNLVLDDPDDIQEELPDSRSADMVITLGGTGRSEQDVMITALEERGVKMLFRGIQARPGHYTAFGLIEGKMPVLCLPGGPSAAEMMFQVLGRRIIHALMGQVGRDLPLELATLAEPISAKPDLTQLVRVRLEEGQHGLIAVPQSGPRVHLGIAAAAGIVIAPPGQDFKPDEQVEVWLTR